MLDSIQTVSTLLGLVLDIVGVILLAREFVIVAAGGTRRLIAAQRDMNLCYSDQAQNAVREAAQARAVAAGWLTILGHDVGLAIRRANARIYDEQVRGHRARANLYPRSMLNADGYWNPDAVREHSSELDDYYRDIGETGTIRETVSRLAVGLILLGFALQFLGALPI